MKHRSEKKTHEHTMRFRFQDVRPEGEQVILDETEAFRLHRPDGEREREIRLVSPVRGILTLRPKAGGLDVKGRIETAVSLHCVRCLKEFIFPLFSDFGALFLPMQHVPDEEERELSPEDLKISFMAGDELFIKDVVEEQIWLAIPMQPLCDAHCKGLCDVCGADLNAGDCGCDRGYGDGRFAVLQNLRYRLPRRRK